MQIKHSHKHTPPKTEDRERRFMWVVRHCVFVSSFGIISVSVVLQEYSCVCQINLLA
jgi:hypothetical protein